MPSHHAIPLSRIRAVWADLDLIGYTPKAAALGVSVGTLHRWAKVLDLPDRPGRDAPHKALDAARIRAVWADGTLPTMADKAAALGISWTTLKRRRRALGLQALPRGPKTALDLGLLQELWLRGVSTIDMARVLKVSRDIIWYRVRIMGLPRRRPGFRALQDLQGVQDDLRQLALRRAMASAAPRIPRVVASSPTEWHADGSGGQTHSPAPAAPRIQVQGTA